MHKGYFKPKKVEKWYAPVVKSKAERWSDFSLDDKINMVHEIVILKRPLSETAKKYHRSPGYVSSLISKIIKQI